MTRDLRTCPDCGAEFDTSEAMSEHYFESHLVDPSGPAADVRTGVTRLRKTDDGGYEPDPDGRLVGFQDESGEWHITKVEDP